MFVDLSHVFEEEMSTFKTLDPPKIGTLFTHEESKEMYNNRCCFEITTVEFQTSCGTYMDSPFHRHKNMRDISQLSLSELILRGVSLDVSNKKPLESIEIEDLNSLSDTDLENKAVLFYTGWDKFWKKEEYHNSPYVSKDVAQFLVEKKVKLAGIDVINIDSSKDEERSCHTILLGNDTLIVENMCNIQKLLNKEFRLFACPLKVKKAAAFPVRVFAEIL